MNIIKIDRSIFIIYNIQNLGMYLDVGQVSSQRLQPLVTTTNKGLI